MNKKWGDGILFSAVPYHERLDTGLRYLLHAEGSMQMINHFTFLGWQTGFLGCLAWDSGMDWRAAVNGNLRMWPCPPGNGVRSTPAPESKGAQKCLWDLHSLTSNAPQRCRRLCDLCGPGWSINICFLSCRTGVKLLCLLHWVVWRTKYNNKSENALYIQGELKRLLWKAIAWVNIMESLCKIFQTMHFSEMISSYSLYLHFGAASLFR